MVREKILKRLESEDIITLGKDNEFEKMFEDYINKHPEDEEMGFRLVIFEFQDEMGDYPKCIMHLKKMIEYNDDNILAKIFLAFIESWYWAGLGDDTLEMLWEICRTNCNPEFKSMAYQIIARYYYSDESKYEEYLLKSIESYPHHVHNYCKLANFYLKRGQGAEVKRVKKAKELLVQAIGNINIITDNRSFFSEINKINYLFINSLTGVNQFEHEVKKLEEQLQTLEEN